MRLQRGRVHVDGNIGRSALTSVDNLACSQQNGQAWMTTWSQHGLRACPVSTTTPIDSHSTDGTLQSFDGKLDIRGRPRKKEPLLRANPRRALADNG